MSHSSKWRRAAALLALILTLTCLPARADEEPQPTSKAPAKADASLPGWYFGASVGPAWGGGLSNRGFTVDNAGVTATVNQGFRLGSGPSVAGQVGYDFHGPRLEGEFLFQSFDRPRTNIQVTGTATPVNVSLGGSSIDTYSLFVNGCYDFHNDSRLTPFVGGGLGLSSLNASSQSSSGVIGQAPGLNQTAFAYQAKVGLGYKMSDAATMYLQYRYVGTSSFKYGGAQVTAGGAVFNIAPASGSLSNSSVELGVRFKI